jgi:hypothetical protein
MDGYCFVIIKDESDSYIRIVDVLEILSAQYSPSERDQVAQFLHGIVMEPYCPDQRLN